MIVVSMQRNLSTETTQMQDQPSRNWEKMPDVIAQQMAWVRRCAAPAEGLSIKAQIRQAARRLGWPYNRTKKVWYGETEVRVREWLELEASNTALLEEAERIRGWIHGNAEALARARAQLRRTGADGSGPMVRAGVEAADT